MTRHFLRAVGVIALAVIWLGPALADINVTPGSGAVIFDFTCFTTKHCPGAVPMRSDGTEVGTASAPLRTDPTGSTTQPVSGTVTANAGTGNFTVIQGTAASLNATVVGTGTFATQATLAAETTKVIGTVNQGTSPWVVSGTVTANGGTNLNTSTLALEAGGNLAQVATDLGAPGATACATDTSSCNNNQQNQRIAQRLTTLNTTLGSPFQAGGSIGNTTFGATVTSWGGGVLGAMANYGTSPGAVLAPGVNAFVTNANANIGNNADAVAASATSVSPVGGFGFVWNGSTWDRMPGSTTGVAVKGASGAFASGSFASGSHASGSFASGAFASGSVASGALASGSIASGAMVDLGAQADAACSTDNGTCSAIALIKRTNQRLTTVNTSIGAANAYETVAASQTAQSLGATGATGDYLSHCVVTPGTTSPGVVTILDNATAIVSFAGGASSTSNLVPFAVPIGAVSVSGAWKITTGANVTVVCVGRFT